MSITGRAEPRDPEPGIVLTPDHWARLCPCDQGHPEPLGRTVHACTLPGTDAAMCLARYRRAWRRGLISNATLAIITDIAAAISGAEDSTLTPDKLIREAFAPAAR